MRVRVCSIRLGSARTRWFGRRIDEFRGNNRSAPMRGRNNMPVGFFSVRRYAGTRAMVHASGCPRGRAPRDTGFRRADGARQVCDLSSTADLDSARPRGNSLPGPAEGQVKSVVGISAGWFPHEREDHSNDHRDTARRLRPRTSRTARSGLQQRLRPAGTAVHGRRPGTRTGWSAGLHSESIFGHFMVGRAWRRGGVASRTVARVNLLHVPVAKPRNNESPEGVTRMGSASRRRADFAESASAGRFFRCRAIRRTVPAR